MPKEFRAHVCLLECSKLPFDLCNILLILLAIAPAGTCFAFQKGNCYRGSSCSYSHGNRNKSESNFCQTTSTSFISSYPSSSSAGYPSPPPYPPQKLSQDSFDNGSSNAMYYSRQNVAYASPGIYNSVSAVTPSSIMSSHRSGFEYGSVVHGHFVLARARQSPLPLPAMFKDALKQKKDIDLCIVGDRVAFVGIKFAHAIVRDAIKSCLVNYQYDDKTHFWTLPQESIEECVRLYKHMGRVPSSSILAMSQQQSRLRGDRDLATRIELDFQLPKIRKADAISKSLEGDSRHIKLTFQYDSCLVAAVKKIHPGYRSYDPAVRVWDLHFLALPDLILALTDDSCGASIIGPNESKTEIPPVNESKTEYNKYECSSALTRLSELCEQLQYELCAVTNPLLEIPNTFAVPAVADDCTYGSESIWTTASNDLLSQIKKMNGDDDDEDNSSQSQPSDSIIGREMPIARPVVVSPLHQTTTPQMSLASHDSSRSTVGMPLEEYNASAIIEELYDEILQLVESKLETGLETSKKGFVDGLCDGAPAEKRQRGIYEFFSVVGTVGTNRVVASPPTPRPSIGVEVGQKRRQEVNEVVYEGISGYQRRNRLMRKENFCPDCGGRELFGTVHVCRFFAKFYCPPCHNTWTSAWAWSGCTQQCLNCQREYHFDPLTAKRIQSGMGRDGCGEHISSACERCKQLGRNCKESLYM